VRHKINRQCQPLEPGAGVKTTATIDFSIENATFTVWHDADYESEDVVTGTWRWAGNSTNLGTLFFGKRDRTLDESLLTRSPNKPGLNHVFIEKEIFKILINNPFHLHSILTQCPV